MNMMQHGIFGGIRDPAGAAVGPANPDSNDAIEPIEIPSSSDESDSEVSYYNLVNWGKHIFKNVSSSIPH